MLDMNVVCECPVCGAVRQVMVNSEDYFAWRFEGKLAQDAFPYLSRVEREAIISGICPTCWNEILEEEEGA
jgi:hypothetical protein